VAMPNSRHARMTRIAISPRLATRTFLNMKRDGYLMMIPIHDLNPSWHAMN